jgi:quinol monooxygenase YgiN
MAEIRLHARLTFEPSDHEAVAGICEELVDRARQDSGVLEYAYFVNGARDAVLILEHYESEDALIAHLGNIDEEAIGRLLPIASMGGVEVVASPTERVAEALAGFGEVTFFEPLCAV